MRVLHVISSGGMYGAEAVILNLLATLELQGHTGVLGIFSNSANPNLQLHEFAQQKGFQSHLIPCRGQLDTSVPASIRALIRETAADVVHAHGYKADLYTYLALRRSGTPFVSTCHNWLDDDLFVRAYGMLDRWSLRHFDAVIAVSEEVRQRLVRSGVPADAVHLIRNGIDLRPFDTAVPSLRNQTEPVDQLQVGWIGRLSREKGPDLFVRAAARVLPEFPGAGFILIGDGPDRIELEHLLEELGIAAQVRLEGRRTDMPEVYASFDMLVSSSRREGLPMAILEGMAAGRPWVATSVGDVPTVVQNGVTGMVVPPEDLPQLADAILTLLRSKQQREQFGTEARALVEREFSAERMSSEYLRIYSRALARRRGERESAVGQQSSRHAS